MLVVRDLFYKVFHEIGQVDDVVVSVFLDFSYFLVQF